MALYSGEIMRHFRKPKNVGKIKNPDALGKVGNLTCGDVMYLYLKIKRKPASAKASAGKEGKEIIKDVKFETFGCTVAIANTSLLTTMIKGKSLDEAMKITKDDLVKKFGNVPLIKVHCSLLAVDALSEAIYDYYKKQGRVIPPELEERHKRAEKIGKEMEHRHSATLELEEELHKGND